MMKMNNKGQVLVAFILMIPIIILIAVAITDVGLMNIEARRVNNTVEIVLNMGLIILIKKI